jgi:hypothetical protein
MPQEMNAQQREYFYHRTGHLVEGYPQDLKSHILDCQADFSS